MYQQVAAVPGNTYHMTFYSGTHEPSKQPTIAIRFYDGTGSEIGTAAIHTITSDLEVSGLGGPYTLSGTAPEGAANLRVIFTDPASTATPFAYTGAKGDALCLTEERPTCGQPGWLLGKRGPDAVGRVCAAGCSAGRSGSDAATPATVVRGCPLEKEARAIKDLLGCDVGQVLQRLDRTLIGAEMRACVIVKRGGFSTCGIQASWPENHNCDVFIFVTFGVQYHKFKV